MESASTRPDRAPSFSFPALPDAPAGTGRPEAPLHSPAEPQTLSSPAAAAPTVKMEPPSILVPPPLPARLAAGGDAAAALALALPAAAASASDPGPGNGSRRAGGEQPSRQVSLDAVAGLLQLPQRTPIQGSLPRASPDRRTPQTRQRTGQAGQRNSPRRGSEVQLGQAAAKRPKTGAAADFPGLQLPQLVLAPPPAIAFPNSTQLDSSHLAAGLQPQLLPWQTQSLAAQAAQLAEAILAAASPQAAPIQPPLPTAPSPAACPTAKHTHSPTRATPGGPTWPSAAAAAAVAGAGPGQPGNAGAAAASCRDASGDAAEDALQQQLLLALLQALPDELRMPEVVVTARTPPSPSTPASLSLGDQPAAPAEVAAGGDGPTASPVVPSPEALLGYASHPTSLPPAAAAAAAAVAAAAGTPPPGPEAAAHQLFAAAAACPMPPMPPTPPFAAAASAAALSGGHLSSEQRLAVFEHSVGVVFWMVQQLQHQAFQHSTLSGVHQQQLGVLQQWAQKVRGCLSQMQSNWRELARAMQAAVREIVGKQKQQQAVLEAMLLVQQQQAEELAQLQAQQAQQEQLKGASPATNGVMAKSESAAVQLSEGAATEAAQQAQQLADENVALREQISQLQNKQAEQHAAGQQLGAALMHERQQRQQVQGAVAALQAQVQLLVGAQASESQ